MAATPRGGQDGYVIPPIDLRNAYGLFRPTCLEAAGLACPQLDAVCADQSEPSDTRFWQRCDDGWIVDITSGGVW